MTAFTVEQTDWPADAARLGAVRRTVFIDEQGVPEALEWDAADASATHFLAQTLEGQPIGCARLLPDGHLGRMAVLREWRGLGVGTALLGAATAVARHRGIARLDISAQVHAEPFYAKAGFEAVGAVYEEAGIAHVRMQKRLDDDDGSGRPISSS